MMITRGKNPLITAIIPIAGFPNGTDQIHSWITEEALANFEVILVLDSDSIETEQIVSEIAATIKEKCTTTVVKSTCRNPGGARNLGLELAKGEWIVFWDCDDIPNPISFLETVKQANEQNADVALGFFTVRSSLVEEDVKLIKFDDAKLLESIAFNPGLWRFAIRNAIAKNLRFKEIRMGEDQIYLAELLIQSVKISVTKKSVYEYWLYPTGQLTKDGTATTDLSIALAYLEQIYLKTKCREIFIVFTRLSITSVKRNPLFQKLRAVAKYLRTILCNLNHFPIAIRTLKMIWNQK